MPLSVSCQSCGKQLRLRDSLEGKTVACPDCQAAIKVRTKRTKPTKGKKSQSRPPAAARPKARRRTRPKRQPDYEEDFDLVESAPRSALPTRSSSRRKRKPCRACSEMILASASVCRFCGEDFRRKRRSSPSRSRSRSNDEEMSGVDALMVVICPGIGFLFALVYLVQGKPKGAKLMLAIFALWGLLILASLVVNSMQ